MVDAVPGAPNAANPGARRRCLRSDLEAMTNELTWVRDRCAQLADRHSFGGGRSPSGQLPLAKIENLHAARRIFDRRSLETSPPERVQ